MDGAFGGGGFGGVEKEGDRKPLYDIVAENGYAVAMGVQDFEAKKGSAEKILFFQEGCPETLYIKFKPAKNQKIHQQYFLPKEQVERINSETGKRESQDVVIIRTAMTKGKQLTTKPIQKISSSKCSWWDDKDLPSKGILD